MHRPDFPQLIWPDFPQIIPSVLKTLLLMKLEYIWPPLTEFYHHYSIFFFFFFFLKVKQTVIRYTDYNHFDDNKSRDRLVRKLLSRKTLEWKLSQSYHQKLSSSYIYEQSSAKSLHRLLKFYTRNTEAMRSAWCIFW